jgi:hypothetical protein
MFRDAARLRLPLALTLIWVVAPAGSAQAQPRSPLPDGRPTDAAPEAPPPGDMRSELDTLRAENAAVRALLLEMQTQQKALLDQVDRLQRRLDGVAAAVAPAGRPIVADAAVQPGPPPAALMGRVHSLSSRCHPTCRGPVGIDGGVVKAIYVVRNPDRPGHLASS